MIIFFFLFDMFRGTFSLTYIPFFFSVFPSFFSFRTSYDAARKQHWLSVYRHNLAVRFLLKDHGRSVERTQVHDSSANDRIIHAAVDQMILAVNQMETTNTAIKNATR